MSQGVKMAIEAAGSQKKLAEKLGCTQQFISNCNFRGYFPIKRAIEIEEKLGIDRIKLIDPRIAEALATAA